MNDANPRRHYAEGGPDDERDPDPQGPYYQEQYGYDAYGRPLAPRQPRPRAPQPPPGQYVRPQSPPPAPQQQGYADPYYTDPAQTFAGQQPGWIPQQQQPQQQPYYEQPPPQPQYGTGGQPLHETGQQPVYETGRPPAYDMGDTGQHAAYDTGQQAGYDTGRQPLHDTGSHTVYGTGQHPVHETGRQPAYGTGRPAGYGTGQQPQYQTGQQPVYETGRQPGYETGPQPLYDAGPQAVREPGPQQSAAEAAPHLAPGSAYQTEQFAFVDEESEESDEVIDWLKFSESRTERREEARRRSHVRRVWLALVLVLALVGGGGYLWRTGRIPGLDKSTATEADSAGGPQQRNVIVVHLLPVNGGPSATALLVDNKTKGRGTTVLIPNSLALTGDDGSSTNLGKSVADGVGPTRDALNALLGTDIKGSWRLDSPYLELLVDSLGDVLVDTNTVVKGTSGKEKGKTLVQQGKQQELNGQAAVAYATYWGPGEAQTDQLGRFGQVMQAVLKKMPSDALGATRDVQALSQILDPSLTDKQLGASLAQLAELAKTGAYGTATLPVQKDGALSAQATDSVVKDVLGGSVKQQHGASAQARVQIKDATGKDRAAALAQAAILNGGTYTYVPGGKASSSQAASQVLYADPARLTAAKDVAATLGLPATAVQKGTVPSNADISVVLGRDYESPSDQ